MKEAKLRRYVGPYLKNQIPFENFIQSPIGLVPKDGGKDVRLIFHLSYPKNGDSVNSNTPPENAQLSILISVMQSSCAWKFLRELMGIKEVLELQN